MAPKGIVGLAMLLLATLGGGTEGATLGGGTEGAGAAGGARWGPAGGIEAREGACGEASGGGATEAGRGDAGATIGGGMLGERTGMGTKCGGGGGLSCSTSTGGGGTLLASYSCCTATMAKGGGGMFGTTPLAAASALVISSGTSLAGCHFVQPGRHTGVLGAIRPAARPARSSSMRTRRCWPFESAHLHVTSAMRKADHTWFCRPCALRPAHSPSHGWSRGYGRRQVKYSHGSGGRQVGDATNSDPVTPEKTLTLSNPAD